MSMWLHLLFSSAIFAVTCVSSSPPQSTPTPYLIIMAKTLYQKNLHYIMFVYNDNPARGLYAVKIDSINPFSGEVKRGRMSYGEFMTYRIPFKNYQEENILLNLTIFSCSAARVCSKQIATESRVLPVIADPSVNLIQISRSHYHRNETVRFRVISYVSNTVALLRGNFDRIYIEDARMQRVNQWLNVPLSQALEGLNFTLSQKALLGKWRINLILGQIVDYEEFQVNDVQRPMFTVQLRQPKYFRLDAKYFSFWVCAEYPYVESLEASIDATFCIEESRGKDLVEMGKYILNKTCIKISHGISDIKECIPFKNKETKGLKLDAILERYKAPHTLLKSVLTVKVKQENGYFVQETVVGDAGNEQMKIYIDSPSFYKPGFPYQGNVSVRFKDHRPVVDAVLLLVTSKLANLNGTRYRTDKQGSFRFGFPPMSADTGTMELSFNVVEHPELSSDPRMVSPKMTKMLQASISKTGGFLQLEIDENSCSASTRTIPFKLKSTVPLAEDSIRAAVISERNLTSYFLFDNTPLPQVCEDTDDALWGHYKCVKGQQIECLEGWRGDNCLTPCTKVQPCATKPNRKTERLTIYTRTGNLDVTETWHRSTQLIVWAKVTRKKITDVISAEVSFKKADICSLRLRSPTVRLDKSSVQQGSLLVMSIAGVNSNEMKCSLSVTRDCKIGCRGDVNDIDSNEKLNELVAEYIAWCHHGGDLSFSDNALQRDFHNAGFTSATNFPIGTSARMRRSAAPRGRRSVQRSQAPAKTSYRRRSVVSDWNLQRFNGPRRQLKFRAPTIPGAWRAQILCVSPRGIRMSPAAKFTVEKPIHVEMSLPVILKVGETYNVPISIMYNRKESSSVKIEATVSNNTKFTLKDKAFTWNKPKHTILNMKVSPQRAGTMSLALRATATPGKGKSFQDVIRFTVTIEPEGTTKNESFEHVSCKDVPGSVRIPPPKVAAGRMVSGSQKVSILFSGNVASENMNNLEYLIRPPNGLGETNMGLLGVNLNILEYYKATNYRNKRVLRLLRGVVLEGCKRQLQFIKPDGSFTANHGMNRTSTWLTTFIFATFYRSKAELPVNDTVFESALNFILSRQSSDGCFEERGFINTFSLAGAFLKKQRDRRQMTAFVLYSLQSVLESGGFRARIAPVLPGAFKCLLRLANAPRHLNIHALAVVARALAKYDSTHPLSKTALAEVRKREIRRGDETFWLTENRDAPYWNRRLASDVETTGHATLAKLWMGNTEALGEVVSTLRWLIRQRNLFQWYTYIDQMEALRALTAAAVISDAKGLFDPTFDVKCYDGEVEKFKTRQIFHEDSRDLVVQHVFASNITEFKYKRLGKGCLLIAIYRYYNVL